MLYWGEGSKYSDSLIFTNTNIKMIKLYLNFLSTHFGIKENDIRISINCYTTNRSLEEIENYWQKKLNFNKNAFNKTIVNKLPISSKGKYKQKDSYGTIKIYVKKGSKILWEIIGAIEEYSNNYDKTF
jgi:hypothetical protein